MEVRSKTVTHWHSHCVPPCSHADVLYYPGFNDLNLLQMERLKLDETANTTQHIQNRNFTFVILGVGGLGLDGVGVGGVGIGGLGVDDFKDSGSLIGLGGGDGEMLVKT